jgi:hypothetical protein
LGTASLQHQIRELIYGFCASQCLYVAAKLRIPDLLGEGERSVSDLASSAHCDPGALRRLLQTLSVHGLFEQQPEDRFSLTPLGALLTSDALDSKLPEVLHAIGPDLWAAWGRLEDAIQTGEAAYRSAVGMGVWEYRAHDADRGRQFDQMTASLAARQGAILLKHCDLSGVETVVDIGGGVGTFLGDILSKRPGLRGVLFDLPQVVAEAPKVLSGLGVQERCEVRPGSFLESVPSGFDVYVMRAVLHDWNDPSATAILKNCRAAMGKAARLVLIEAVLQAGQSKLAHLSDLHMLVVHGGKERTLEEFQRLFASTGFELSKSVTTLTGSTLIEAKTVEKGEP